MLVSSPLRAARCRSSVCVFTTVSSQCLRAEGGRKLFEACPGLIDGTIDTLMDNLDLLILPFVRHLHVLPQLPEWAKL